MGIISELQDSFDIDQTIFEEDLIISFDEYNQEVDNTSSNESENVFMKRKMHKSKAAKPGGTLPEKRPRGSKKRRRYENTVRLLEQADPDDLEAVTIYDFITPKLSVFAQLLLERHCMKAWNEFISSSENDQQRVINSGGKATDQHVKSNCSKRHGGSRARMQSVGDSDTTVDASWDSLDDIDESRQVEPYFSGEECFEHIDAKLRSMLRRRHVPMGLLRHLESEVVSFFTDYPGDVCMYQLASSYHRMMLHAVAQYLSLHSTSYYSDGGETSDDMKNTYIENKNNDRHFQPPAILLSQYLHVLKSQS